MKTNSIIKSRVQYVCTGYVVCDAWCDSPNYYYLSIENIISIKSFLLWVSQKWSAVNEDKIIEIKKLKHFIHSCFIYRSTWNECHGNYGPTYVFQCQEIAWKFRRTRFCVYELWTLENVTSYYPRVYKLISLFFASIKVHWPVSVLLLLSPLTAKRNETELKACTLHISFHFY